MSSSSKHGDVMSFNDYIEFLRIPHEDIKLATNNFSDENLVKQYPSYKVYKGQLIFHSGDLINIVVRYYQDVINEFPENMKSLENELTLSHLLTHKNIISVFMIGSMIGSIRKGEVIIVNKHEANGSLKKHLSDSTTLSWIRRLHICVRVADALKYLHYDAQDHDHVIHGNIKSSKILLDHEWEPKIYGFGSAFVAKKHHLHLTRQYKGTLQYNDPAYTNTGGLTHKSDVFSFGVLLFEVLFGREASIQDNDNWYFARLARSHYEDKKLEDLIDPDLRKQMNSQSLEIFAATAYYCLKEQRRQRLDINQVLSKLEKALEIQENPEAATSSNNLKEKSLDHLRFRLLDIKSATKNFSNDYKIGSGAFGVVYKAELKCPGETNLLAIEEKTKAKISNKVSTVAIKRIFNRNDEEGKQGFISEIEMLSNCKHPNIVSLQGFCDEGEEMILVYEYVSNGSLADHFENIDNKTNLTWGQRMQICLDIAHGLKYLHSRTGDKQSIIHRDIKSANILLDHKWVAKIADFGLSKLHPASEQGSTLVTKNIAGTDVYLDPEYISTGRLKAKSDVYSFGVVLFEIMCGKLAYDKTYDPEWLPTIAQECFNNGALKSLVDTEILEAGENISMLIGGVDDDSFDTFTKVANKCLSETQLERPTIEVAIIELQKALNFQINNKERFCISLEAIQLGTQNFNDSNCIGEGRFWKLYEGDFIDGHGHTAIIVKRWDTKFGRQGHIQLLRELDILSRCKHESIIGLVGYCIEMDENIVVYEHASNGTLDKHLGDPRLTWVKRLKICIDVASGIEFLHKGSLDEKDSMIHRDIKSSSILLDSDWNAKIANFEFSCKGNVSERAEHVDDSACDSSGYIDPRYEVDGFLTTSSDIYSLGVILIEMLYGRLVWAKRSEDHPQSLSQLALKHYDEEKSFNEMIFEGINEQVATQSLTKFVDTAIRCLKSDEDITASEVVKHMKIALVYQKVSDENNLNIPLEAIKVGTGNFSDHNCIGEGPFWKLYEGELVDAKGCTTNIVAKRWDAKSRQGHIQQLETELHILLNYKHENIIGLIGYCIEMDENIIIYKHAPNGRLDKHLGDPSLTWMTRLKICINVANGLRFLHEDDINGKDPMKHRDIKSRSILLDGNWNAKISNFEFSCNKSVRHTVEGLEVNICHSKRYVDPRCETGGELTEYADIFSLGVILIEMLCGKLACGEECEDESQCLCRLAIEHLEEKESLDEMIFEGIKQQISPLSLDMFLKAAYECLRGGRWICLKARDLVTRLEEVLEFQEDHETWNPRLPVDYEEIIRASIPRIDDDSEHMKKDIYAMLSKGVILQGGKTMFSLGSKGERNEMISARMFSYKHRNSRKWRSVQESRFMKAAEVFNYSEMDIKIKITPRLISPGVYYGVYLIFKFCDSKKNSSKPMYVNLKYQKGGHNLRAYFATWRDDNWMEIEFYRFFSDKKDTDFEVLLESFSRSHCGNGSIYVEGIEFRVIDNVVENNNDIEQVQHIQKSNPSKAHLLSLNEVDEEEHLMISAPEVLFLPCNGTKVCTIRYFHLHPLAESSFQEVVEILQEHVFHIRSIIRSTRFSQDTDYLCYLVFKLSEKCVGLHGPVRVRDLNKNKKNAEIVYFRSPSPWNIPENNSVPTQREDGWMEVKVSKFNSSQLTSSCNPMILKLITYEGTMSGLIVRGMEVRPM